MELLLFLIIVGGLYLYKKRRERLQEIEYIYNTRQEFTREDNELIKGYKLHVTPQITTRLKVLKMRDHIFQSNKEAESIDFRQDEAIVSAKTKTWKELDIDLGEPSEENEKAWTDIGMMGPNETERYYAFLEKLRTIIERESPKAEKLKQIKSIVIGSRFKLKISKKYGHNFSENILKTTKKSNYEK